MTSIWSKVTQYFDKTEEKNERAQYCRYVPPPILRAELQIPPSVIESYRAGYHESGEHERERSRIDRNRFGVEFATLVFTILAFGVLVSTLYVAWETAYTTRRQLELSEQPWVGISRSRVSDVEGGKAPIITTFLTNFGDTPAFEVEEQAVFGLVLPSTPTVILVEEVGKRPIKRMGTIFPNQILARDFTLGGTMTEGGMKDLISEKIELHKFGVIRYKDRFGKLHHTWTYQPYDPKLKEIVHLSRPDMPRDD